MNSRKDLCICNKIYSKSLELKSTLQIYYLKVRLKSIAKNEILPDINKSDVGTTLITKTEKNLFE